MKGFYMMSINTRFTAAVLAVAVLTTSQVAAFSLQRLFTPKVMMLGLASACYVRLITKGSNHDYKMSDWAEDLREIMEDYNIFDRELYGKLLALFDKYVVGRQVSILDVSYRSKNEDGTIITLKDKKLKCKPFGLMGYFEAYVIRSLSKLGDIGKDWKSTNEFYGMFDDAVIVSGDNNIVVIK